MNKGKQLIVAMAVLAGLVAVTLWVKRDPFENPGKKDYSALLPQRSEGSIDRISVRNRDGSLTLERRSDAWWISQPRELPAEESGAKSAASFLERLAVVDIASMKTERHSEYGLGKDNPEAVEVKAFSSGTEVLNFTAGKPAPDFQGGFVLLSADSQTVYRTNAMLPPLFNRPLKDWRSKTIVDLPKEDVDRIKLVNSKGTLLLQKDAEGKWHKQDDPGWTPDMNRLNQLAGAFTRFSWTEVVDDPGPDNDYGFNSPQAQVVLTARGKDYALTIGKDIEEPKGNCWIRMEGDVKVYQVRKPMIERFTRDWNYYSEEKPEAAPPEKPAENPAAKTDKKPASKPEAAKPDPKSKEDKTTPGPKGKK